MKILTFSRLSLSLGFALMIMVLWIGASPCVVGAKALFGGQVADGLCCTGTTAGDCGAECGGWALTTCDAGGSGPAVCYCPSQTLKCDDIDGCRWCDAACGT